MEELKKKKRSLWANKYVLIGGVFLLWMTIFDSNSFWLQYRLWLQNSKLEEKKDYLESQIQNWEAQSDALNKDKRHQEKHAREEMNMKHKNEDAYIFEPAPKENAKF